MIEPTTKEKLKLVMEYFIEVNSPERTEQHTLYPEVLRLKDDLIDRLTRDPASGLPLLCKLGEEHIDNPATRALGILYFMLYGMAHVYCLDDERMTLEGLRRAHDEFMAARSQGDREPSGAV